MRALNIAPFGISFAAKEPATSGPHGMLLDEIKHVLKSSKCGGKQIGVTRQPHIRGPWFNPVAGSSSRRR
jgi:hypothetical protein